MRTALSVCVCFIRTHTDAFAWYCKQRGLPIMAATAARAPGVPAGLVVRTLRPLEPNPAY
jgi:hypothetical protein